MAGKSSFTIRDAVPREAAALSALAFRSKAHWGYSAEFMEACRPELTISPSDITGCPSRVADRDGALLGFYILLHLDPRRVELADLFVDTPSIGTGVGRALMQHAIDAARDDGYEVMVIQADPHAEPFYRAAGARTVSTRPSDSMPGRDLPLMELSLP
jgi:GNAT superfamily N-acetyltransferase